MLSQEVVPSSVMTRMSTICLLLASVALGGDAKYDGSRVHYESYGKGKDAVVFIHGWTCDLTFWRGQEPVYRNQRALLIDLPGHGESDKPEVAYTQERFARAVEAVMRNAGVERGVLVGHSMGGPVAFTVLRLFPDKVKGLVLIDSFIPAAPKNDEERAKQKAQMAPFLASFRAPTYKETATKMIESMFSAKTTPEQREEIRSKMSTAPQHVMASAIEEMFSMDPPKTGESYKIPVLAIQAEKSNRPGSEAHLRTIFPNLTYNVWSDAGHFLMVESPERFNRELSEFLAAPSK